LIRLIRLDSLFLFIFYDCTAGLYISARKHVNTVLPRKLTTGAGLQKWRDEVA
jgi:hypothetical protein